MCKNYIQLDQLKKIKRTKSRLKRKIKCYEIKFAMYKLNNRMLKVENLIKNTPSRLHHIHQRRGLLKTLSNIYDGDICKNSKGHSVINRFCKRLHPRSLAGFLIYVIIKENNLLQYSSKSNSWHFISVSFKLQSYFS